MKKTNIIIRKATSFVRNLFYGKTFICPVCHLELSYYDTDEDGLIVCPLCGVVIELTDVWGHPLPVVHDFEIHRVQPKTRMHPILTHIPVALWPFTLLGALFLAFMSIVQPMIMRFKPGLMIGHYARFVNEIPYVSQLVMILLGVSTAVSIFTALSGVLDWSFRYSRRPYKIITMKIVLSFVFFGLGVAAFLLHVNGLVFTPSTGLIPMITPNIITGSIYLVLLIANMLMITVLGHIGGNLVFGK